MHTKRPGRRGKALSVVGVLMALIVATTATVAAWGSLGTSYPLTNGNGWYSASSVTGSFRFDVDGSAPSPRSDGDYSERIVGISCSGGGVDVSSDTIQYGPTAGINVTVSGDTTFSGVTVVCTAEYERYEFDECGSFLGNHYCEVSGPWLSIGTVQNARTFKLDSSPPVSVQAVPSALPNANGWYRTPATVSWTGQDPHSGIQSCTTNHPISGPDGQNGFTGNCANYAGLQTYESFGYKFDGTAPTLAPSVSPSTVNLNGSATASPNALDNRSGIDTASCDPVDTSVAGTHSVSCTATDMAGNSTTASATYTVVGYNSSGFTAPVDADALNLAVAGQAIPLKWRLLDGDGAPVTGIASVTVAATSLACDLDATADGIEEYAANSSGLQNLGDGYYQYNWKSPKGYAKSCKTLHLGVGGGLELTADFRFGK